VEFLEVETVSEDFFRVRAQRQDLALPDLVREGLAGRADVAVDLVLDVVRGERGVPKVSSVWIV
jgi:hypothetical protein